MGSAPSTTLSREGQFGGFHLFLPHGISSSGKKGKEPFLTFSFFQRRKRVGLLNGEKEGETRSGYLPFLVQRRRG